MATKPILWVFRQPQKATAVAVFSQGRLAAGATNAQATAALKWEAWLCLMRQGNYGGTSRRRRKPVIGRAVGHGVPQLHAPHIKGVDLCERVHFARGCVDGRGSKARRRWC